MTIEQLNQIREEKRELVMIRKIVKEEGEKLAANTGYRKQVLICGGTGCTSSGSNVIIDALVDDTLREETKYWDFYYEGNLQQEGIAEVEDPETVIPL